VMYCFLHGQAYVKEDPYPEDDHQDYGDETEITEEKS